MSQTLAQYQTLAYYPTHMKDFIVEELGKVNQTIRLVFAIVALGMGLDAAFIRRIIHFKSSTSIAKYLQETGRAGRETKVGSRKVLKTLIVMITRIYKEIKPGPFVTLACSAECKQS